jgi:hypothetical protein
VSLCLDVDPPFVEGPLPYLYAQGSALGEAGSCIRRRDALTPDVTTDRAVDSCLLTSRKEPRPGDRPYARAPKGETAHAVVVVTAPGYGSRAAYGVRHRPGAR